MNENGRYRDLEVRVRDERTRLEGVRADYELIMRSRFHALRMLWFCLKQLFGFSSSDDVYAVWSAGVAPSLTGTRRQPRSKGRTEVAPEAGFSEEETALVASWNERIAARPMGDPPLVTVVIPFYGRRDLTVRCLQSLADSWFESLDVQFVLVDDGSTDQTSAVVTRLDGVEYVRSSKNEGFVRACNRGAALARGKYVCFLNNDTIVTDGWLDYLATTLEHEPAIGVAGSKLVFPDGRLQEAGGILWRDASGWNVGRNEHAADPRFNFLREVDYVSGASLIVRTDLFRRLADSPKRSARRITKTPISASVRARLAIASSINLGRSWFTKTAGALPTPRAGRNAFRKSIVRSFARSGATNSPSTSKTTGRTCPRRCAGIAKAPRYSSSIRTFRSTIANRVRSG